MNEQICLTNLQKIISTEVEESDNEQVFPNELENFFHKIADDLFSIPPQHSTGHKFKHMLWNYLNLKTEIKSRFDEKVLSAWQSFHEMPAEASVEITDGPEAIEKVVDNPEKKKASEVAVARTRGDKKKRQTGTKSLTNDLSDLTRGLKALEKKLEKMVKAVDHIAGQKAGKTKILT